MSRRRCVALLALAVAAGPTAAVAQERAADIGARLVQRPEVRAALEAVRDGEPWVIEQQIALCEIPAPPFGEGPRGEAFARAFRELGLEHVRTDAVGNVLGEMRGSAARPHLVFSAHLDTVFPPGTDVTVTRDGSVLYGTGITDDCRGLAVVLGVVRALKQAAVDLAGTITFAGTVGEEGLGDLRGVKHLFAEELAGRVDRFVSVDGPATSVKHVAVGSRRYRVTYRGPGGHSFGAFGIVNPIHALGRAIARFADSVVPEAPKTTFNVGRIGGGTSINSIAFEAWMEVDMRSVDPERLAELETGFLAALQQALERERERWDGGEKLTVEAELVGDRPAGSMDESSPIVLAMASVGDALGIEFVANPASTDSNLPISLGIPAVTIGGGGTSTGVHSLDETFDTAESWRGTQRALLLAIALAEQ